MKEPIHILARSLTDPSAAASFARFGDLIQAGAHSSWINAGTAQRFDDLTQLDLHDQGGVPCLALFRTGATERAAAYRLSVFERHLLGSQTFVPLAQGRCLAVLTTGDLQPDETAIQAFVVEPGQGITLRRGVWHHPLITLGGADVLVIERRGPQVDCDVRRIRGDFDVVL